MKRYLFGGEGGGIPRRTQGDCERRMTQCNPFGFINGTNDFAGK